MVSTPSSLKTLKIMSAPLISLPANGETLDGDGSILHSLGKLKMQGGSTQCVRMTQHGTKATGDIADEIVALLHTWSPLPRNGWSHGRDWNDCRVTLSDSYSSNARATRAACCAKCMEA